MKSIFTVFQDFLKSCFVEFPAVDEQIHLHICPKVNVIFNVSFFHSFSSSTLQMPMDKRFFMITIDLPV